MPNHATLRALCHHCAVQLETSEREVYGYQCHDCVVREHELILLVRTDPDHPDRAWLDNGPIDLGLPAAGLRLRTDRRATRTIRESAPTTETRAVRRRRSVALP